MTASSPRPVPGLPNAGFADLPMAEKPIGMRPPCVPAAPDTTGRELRELREALAREISSCTGFGLPAGYDLAARLLIGPLRDLLAERDKLAAQVQAVEGLHKPVVNWAERECEACSWSDDDGCSYIAPWPCPTSRALGTPMTGGGE